MTPWTAHARLPCPSLSPGVCSNSCASSQWCHLTISSSIAPFFCLQCFPASGSFLMSWLFASSGQRIGVSASASVLQWIFGVDFLYYWLVCSPWQCKSKISFVSTLKVGENLVPPTHIHQRHTPIVWAGTRITGKPCENTDSWFHLQGFWLQVSVTSPRTCVSSKFPGDGCWFKTTQ